MVPMPRVCCQASHKHSPYPPIPRHHQKIVFRQFVELQFSQPGTFRYNGRTTVPTCLNNSMVGTVLWYVKVLGYTVLSYVVCS